MASGSSTTVMEAMVTMDMMMNMVMRSLVMFHMLPNDWGMTRPAIIHRGSPNGLDGGLFRTSVFCTWKRINIKLYKICNRTCYVSSDLKHKNVHFYCHGGAIVRFLHSCKILHAKWSRSVMNNTFLYFICCSTNKPLACMQKSAVCLPVLLGGLDRFLRFLQTANMTNTHNKIRNITASNTPEIMPIFCVKVP